MITRELIVEKLKAGLEPLQYVNAMWLEGADASGHVDRYSDLDIYIDILDDFEEQAIESVERLLACISEVDYKYVVKHRHPKLRQRIYHLKGTDEYLAIDFVWQLHSRPKEEYLYIRGNTIEAARVIFDKVGIIRYEDPDERDYAAANTACLEECIYRYAQHARVLKYVRRGNYLEAYAYYNKYVLEPLITLLRLIHTPYHADYYLVHISQHIPESELRKLEFFAKVSALEDVEQRVPLAQDWFRELVQLFNAQVDWEEMRPVHPR